MSINSFNTNNPNLNSLEDINWDQINFSDEISSLPEPIINESKFRPYIPDFCNLNVGILNTFSFPEFQETQQLNCTIPEDKKSQLAQVDDVQESFIKFQKFTIDPNSITAVRYSGILELFANLASDVNINNIGFQHNSITNEISLKELCEHQSISFVNTMRIYVSIFQTELPDKPGCFLPNVMKCVSMTPEKVFLSLENNEITIRIEDRDKEYHYEYTSIKNQQKRTTNETQRARNKRHFKNFCCNIITQIAEDLKIKSTTVNDFFKNKLDSDTDEMFSKTILLSRLNKWIEEISKLNKLDADFQYDTLNDTFSITDFTESNVSTLDKLSIQNKSPSQTKIEKRDLDDFIEKNVKRQKLAPTSTTGPLLNCVSDSKNNIDSAAILPISDRSILGSFKDLSSDIKIVYTREQVSISNAISLKELCASQSITFINAIRIYKHIFKEEIDKKNNFPGQKKCIKMISENVFLSLEKNKITVGLTLSKKDFPADYSKKMDYSRMNRSSDSSTSQYKRNFKRFCFNIITNIAGHLIVNCTTVNKFLENNFDDELKEKFTKSILLSRLNALIKEIS